MTTSQKLLHVLIIALVCSVMFLSSPINAADESAPRSDAKSFDIPAQEVSSALVTYANQAGVQVVVVADNVRGMITLPISGRYEPRKALEMMLGHLRLNVKWTTDNTVAITRVAAEGAENNFPVPTISDELEAIEVTARKTIENLQTTPVAVTALTAQSLQIHQVQQVIDLQRVTPSLSIGGAGTGPSSFVNLAIRGEAQNNPTSGSDSAVGLYVDGVYYARSIIGNQGMLDMASAEVLRGPQGTLFGRNTTGGAMDLMTQQPTQKLEGSISVGAGNYNQHLVDVIANVPLNDQLAARVAFRFDNRSGYGRDAVTGAPLSDIDGEYIGRVSVKWTPADIPLTAVVTADYTNYKDDGVMTTTYLNLNQVIVPAGGLYPGSPVLTTGGTFALAGLTNPTQYANNPKNFYTSYSDPKTGLAEIDAPSDTNVDKGLVGTMDADLGGLHLKSITAYRESNTSNSVDLDGTPVDIESFFSLYRQHQISQEIRLSGRFRSLDWIGGLYYFDEVGREINVSQSLGVLAPGQTPFYLGYPDYTAESDGVFGQTNYHFTDQLRGTVGLRETWDKRSINRHDLSDIAADICAVGVDAGTVAGVDCNDPHSATFHYPSWTAGLDYQVTGQLFVYGKTSGAALAGGFNTEPTPNGLGAFQPEKVKDIELGLKADLFDSKVRTNTALFYSWRNGVQNTVNEFVDGTLSQYVRNAGDVRAYGVEFEGTALPWHGMELTTAVAYLHARYVPGSFVVEGIAGPYDRSSELVQQSPAWTADIGATQSFDLPFGKASVHADYSYVSSRAYYQNTADPGDPTQLPADYAVANQLGVIPGYGLLSARAALTLRNPDLEISFWGRNLTATQYFQAEYNLWTALGLVERYQGNPRTYGINLTYHW